MVSLISIVIGLNSFIVHPLHVSVTEIELKEEPREMEITMRIFIDDLETAVRKQRSEPDLDITKPGNGKTTDDLIGNYISSRFTLSLDGTRPEWKYLGSETENDVFYIYMLVSKVPPWKTITVYNSVIMDAYDDESNIVNVSVKDEVRSLRLTNSNKSGKLEF